MKLRAIAPVALVALVAAACADSTSTTSDDGGIQHPTGTDQLVLRVETGGGYTAPEFQLRLIPEFSLYGDGTIITPGPQIEIYPPPANRCPKTACRRSCRPRSTPASTPTTT